MTGETIQFNNRVRESVVEQWREFLHENDARPGATLEKAMLEYMDKDRFARVEANQEEMMELIEGVLSEDSLERERREVSKTTGPLEATSPTSPNTPTDKRIKAIMADIPSGATMTEAMLDTAIETHAGSSYKTLQKYKRLLRKRRHVFDHPAEPEKFVTSHEKLAMVCETHQQVSPSDIQEIVDTHKDVLGATLEYPEEWYLESLVNVAEPYVKANELKFDEVPTFDSTEFLTEAGVLDDDSDGKRGFQ